jgi:hypothetical protein
MSKEISPHYISEIQINKLNFEKKTYRVDLEQVLNIQVAKFWVSQQVAEGSYLLAMLLGDNE